jgi:hypothetical protein
VTVKEFRGLSPAARAAFYELVSSAAMLAEDDNEAVRAMSTALLARAGFLVEHPDQLRIEPDPVALERALGYAAEAWRNVQDDLGKTNTEGNFYAT